MFGKLTLLASSVILLPFAAPAVLLAQELPKITEVRSILREAAAAVLNIDSTQQSAAAANIAGHQARAGDLEGALTTMRAVAVAPDRDLPASSVAYALAANGKLPMALHLLEDLTNPGLRANGYSTIARLLAHKGDFESARNVARLIAKDPSQNLQLTIALAGVAAEQWEAGDRAGAAATFNDGMAAAEGEGNGSAFSALISTLMPSGYRDAALVAVERVYAMADEAPRNSDNSEILNQLAIAQATVGDVRSAIGTAGRIAPGKRDAAEEAIAVALAKQGDESGALQAADEIQGYRLNCLNWIAETLVHAGDDYGAVAAIGRVQDMSERAVGLALVAIRQAEKHSPAASLTAELALETARSVKTADPRGVLTFVAIARGMMGDFAGAADIIEDLDAQDRFSPLWSLTEYMVEAGKKEEALTLARSQDAPLPRAYALLGIGAELLEQLETAAKQWAAISHP